MANRHNPRCISSFQFKLHTRLCSGTYTDETWGGQFGKA